MNFRFVFIALTIAGVLVVGAFALHSRRPPAVVDQPSASLVRASGKCAECHSNQQYSIVHEYELSKHAEKHVSCLECHRAAKGQESKPHHGFEINTQVTAANCRSCHESIYQQFLRSRHAAHPGRRFTAANHLRPSKSHSANSFIQSRSNGPRTHWRHWRETRPSRAAA